MATFTSPITWVTGAVTAAQFNQQIRDNETWLKGAFTQLNVTSDAAKAKITPALVGCRVYKAALQSIPDSTTTTVQFDSERFDSDAFHDTSTNNTRITIPASMGGYYYMGVNVAWASNASGWRFVGIQHSSGLIIAFDRRVTLSGANVAMQVNTLYQMAAAEYVEVIVAQNSTASLNLEADTNYSPEFWMHRISST